MVELTSEDRMREAIKGATLALRVMFGYEPALAKKLMPPSNKQQTPEALERIAERLMQAVVEGE